METFIRFYVYILPIFCPITTSLQTEYWISALQIYEHADEDEDDDWAVIKNYVLPKEANWLDPEYIYHGYTFFFLDIVCLRITHAYITVPPARRLTYIELCTLSR